MLYTNRKTNCAAEGAAWIALMIGGLAMGGYYAVKILRENCFCRRGGKSAFGTEQNQNTDDCNCGCRTSYEEEDCTDDEATAVNCEGRTVTCRHKKENSKKDSDFRQ